MTLEDLWKVIITPEGAGGVGAAISLRWVPGKTWLSRISAFGAGLAFALFVVPFLVDYLEIKSIKGIVAFAFVGGLTGMNVLAKVWEFARDVELQKLLSFFPKRDGGK